MLKRAVLAIGLAASCLCAPSAQAKDWLVERVSGTVWAMGPDRNPKRVQAKMMVPEGITVTTAADGRVRLSSENSVMTLAPNSVVAVFAGASQSRTVNIMQKTGSVEFEVEKRAKPYFTVSSPYMAAVVKGTKFTVDVAKKSTKIDVARGLVQVTDIRSGQTSAVGAGQAAQVSTAKAGLATQGPVSPKVFQGKPQNPVVAPAGMNLSTFRAQATENVSTETSPASRQGESPAAAAASSSFSSGYSTGQALGSGGRTNSVGGSGNGSGHRGNAEAIGRGAGADASDGDRTAANGNPRGRGGSENDANGKGPGGLGPKGPGGGNGKGPGGNGPKGPGGNGPGGPGPKGPGGDNGKGNGPGGNGPKGPDGNGPGGPGPKGPGGPGGPGFGGHGPEGTRGNGPGGNGKGNNGNGNGNGGPNGTDGGNNKGNNGNGNDGKAK